MRTLAHFIGTLVVTRPAVPTGALHYRALQDLKIRALHQSSSYQMMGQITKDVQVELQWWATQVPTCLLFSNSEARGQDHDRVRCLKFRLGCSLSRGENRGEVDATGMTTTHQLFRVDGIFPSFTILSENQEWDKCSH